MALVTFVNESAPYLNAENLNKIQEGNVYSTNEIEIGKGINNEPIYRKVVVYTPNETIGEIGAMKNITIPHGISNFKNIVNARLSNSNNYIFPVSGSRSGTTADTWTGILAVNSTGILFRVINDTWGTTNTFYFTLEYTKNTD